MTKKAIYPGTFDPITNGHLDIIRRASELFDTVIVAVAQSSGKNPLFDKAERLNLSQQVLSGISNVEVLSFDGLLVNLAADEGANIIVRGVRSIADFEYEVQMAGMNRRMMPELDTVFLTPDSQWADLSSTLVRDIARHGGDVSGFVPSNIETAITKKLG
ncbi:MAG: pantetheine-phosphate adenylyltransferase [Cycloclasticus sp.]|nr:pantetheine-phosphate adenylyltransferase [Cycloclasticus sp.]